MITSMNPKRAALVKTACAFLIWSLFGPILNLSSLSVHQNIWGVSVVGLLAITLLVTRSGVWKDIRKVRVTKGLLIFLVASGISGILWLTALTIVPIGQATLLWTTIPLATLLLAAVVLKERITLMKVYALMAGFFGVVVIVWANVGAFRLNTSLTTGLIFIFIAVFLKACQAVLAKHFSLTYPAWVTTWLIIASQAVFTTPMALMTPWANTTLFSLVSVVMLGILSAWAFFLFIGGFSRLSSSSVTMVGYIEPLLAATWGHLFLHQGISAWIIAGGAFILLAGYLLSKSESK